ncbi:hypothetical protein [Demequina subtropica]|uniref:hypothetical protein n=1 Tax=Demequina subtropica TaxID=1638989 RepID=UPI0007856CC8|nr:hypothetical protein [Demequina subtropica]
MARKNDAPAPEPAADPAPEPQRDMSAGSEADPATMSRQEPGEPAGPAPVASSAPPSVLERVRSNRTGPLAAGLGVAFAVALLLAVLVPNVPNLYALTVLGLLLTAAVGFTVRYLSHERDLMAQGAGFIATLLGIHIMGVTGTIDTTGSGLDGLLGLIGAEAPGFDDALLGALATPAVSAGGVLCGLIAAIIVGWGPRDRG